MSPKDSEAFDPYYQWLSIPRAEQPTNHYRLLGVSLFEASPDVIENAAEQRTVYVRTFQLGRHSDESQRILNEIAVARICLLNSAKKAEYDASLQSAMAAPPVAVSPPPAYPSEPPVASLETTTVSAGALPGPESVHERVTRRRTPKSPLVELVKIVGGGIAGLVIAYCLLLFVFQIDILARLSSRKSAQLQETAIRPAEPQTRSAETETKSKTTERAEGQPTPSGIAVAPEPDSDVATPDSPRHAASDDVAQAAADQSPPAEAVAEPAEQGPGETAAVDSAASGAIPEATKGPVAESAVVSAQPADAVSDGPAAEPANATERPGSPTPVTAVRGSVPTKDEQGQAAKQLREIFKRQYADATTPEGQLALAALLRNEASKLGDDPVARFVMLKEAYDNALGGEDYGMAEDVARELCAAYDVDLNSVMTHLLATALKSVRTNEARHEIAGKAIRFIEMLTTIERFDEALSLAAAVEAQTSRLRDTEVRRQLASARDNAQTKKHAWEAVQQASERLKATPDDPAANLIMGKHLCWTKDDWTHGLPMLAKGSDPELAAVATMDLAGAVEPAKQVKVGDAWWALAETKQGEERDAMLFRAGFWYRQAEPNVQAGLARLKVTQRLTEISKLGLNKPFPSNVPGVASPSLSREDAEQDQIKKVYTVIDLGPSYTPLAINDRSDVVGIRNAESDTHRAFLYSGGRFVDLGQLSGHNQSRAVDVNNDGVVVGASMDAKTTRSLRPIEYRTMTVRDLGSLGGGYGFATAINNKGQIVGLSSLPNGNTHAFQYSDGKFINLSSASKTVAGYSCAWGITDDGIVVGIYVSTSQLERGFLWRNGTWIDLGDLQGGAGKTQAYKINRLGQVVGNTTIAGSLPHAFVWEDGVMRDLGVLPNGSDSSRAESINDYGSVVGTSYRLGTSGKASSHRAFVWDSNSGLIDLNSLMDASGKGWILSVCKDINNAGQIVGTGLAPNGQQHGFLLVRSAETEDGRAETRIGSGPETDEPARPIQSAPAVTPNTAKPTRLDPRPSPLLPSTRLPRAGMEDGTLNDNRQTVDALLTGQASKDDEVFVDFLGSDSVGLFLTGKKMKDLLKTL